jgi:FixJ family two-component response regulator
MPTVTLTDTGLRGRPAAGLTPLVYIVDDDVSVRESIACLMEEAGWRAESFSSAQEFLDRPRGQRPCCLILDVGLPDLNGLDVQQRVSRPHAEMPIIFVTGRGDIPTTVRAMRAGAAEFLTKPVDSDTLTHAVESALERSRFLLEAKAESQVLRALHQALSQREREVMALVIRGQLNKQIGSALGISEITVKAHRGRMMRKMKVRSVPDLVRVAARLGLDTEETS